MENPTLYKKEALTSVRNRTTVPLTDSEMTRVSTVVGKFFELFAAKHM